jgi:hypothetical protein
MGNGHGAAIVEPKRKEVIGGVQQYTNQPGLANVMASCFLIFIAVLLVRHPRYDNWDAFAYVAVALRDAGMPADQIHGATFKIMQDFLPPAYWDLLTGHGSVDAEFRQAVATNASAFMEQLPFYSVKPVYPALMAASWEAGAGMIASAMAIGSAAYFGFGVLVYVWFRRWMQPVIAFAIMALMMLNPYLVAVGRTISPDMLSALAIALTAFVIIEHRRLALVSAAILLLAILIRPENIIYAGLFLVYMGYRGDIRLSWVVMLLVGVAAIYLIETQASGNYGWKTLFEYTFVNKSVAPAEEAHHNILFYVEAYLGRIDLILFGSSVELPIFALVTFGALCLKSRTPAFWTDPYVHLVLICIVLAFARIAILPQNLGRALLAVYMLLTIAFVQACCDLMAQVTPRHSTPSPGASVN